MAHALSNLMLALGQVPKKRAPTKPEEPNKVVAEEAPPRARPRRRRSGRELAGSPEERFQAFVDGLPTRSREFLELVRDSGTLTIADAVKNLDIKVPKAIGGITGSLTRWARERGVDIPIEAGLDSKGDRVWHWLGGDAVPKPKPVASNTASRVAPVTAPKAPAEEPPAKPTKRRRRRARTQSSKTAEVASSAKEPAAEESTETKTISEPAPKPVTQKSAPKKPATPVKKQATRAAKAPKGPTEAEVSAPASAPRRSRKKASAEAPVEVADVAPSEPVQEVAPSEPVHEVAPSEPVQEEAGELFSDPRYASLVEGARELSREFLLLLASREEVTMSEALKEFGLARGQVIGAVVRALKGRAADNGLALPFKVTRSNSGERMWRWLGWPEPSTPEETKEVGTVRRRRRPRA